MGWMLVTASSERLLVRLRDIVRAALACRGVWFWNCTLWMSEKHNLYSARSDPPLPFAGENAERVLFGMSLGHVAKRGELLRKQIKEESRSQRKTFHTKIYSTRYVEDLNAAGKLREEEK